jgi:hypothetical protein
MIFFVPKWVNAWAYGARYVRAALAHLTGLHTSARP